ncbi:hypothetical protein GCM10010172_31790 [Paractinoplanes ferrugineus]|uniref:Uncharacterized protein n=1 Tax=Paractinoplanes ferrugineus TaxID=113564 RepID=A0A919J5T5_9ACTN|nr:hypothetical protein Afe05nite_59690 [Actinoplanes ferrugineus]
MFADHVRLMGAIARGQRKGSRYLPAGDPGGAGNSPDNVHQRIGESLPEATSDAPLGRISIARHPTAPVFFGMRIGHAIHSASAVMATAVVRCCPALSFISPHNAFCGLPDASACGPTAQYPPAADVSRGKWWGTALLPMVLDRLAGGG